MPSLQEPKRTSLVNNAVWVSKLNWKYLRGISVARLIGYLNENVNQLLRAFVLGLVIDWTLAYSQNPSDSSLITKTLVVFAAYYLITGTAGVLRNYGANLISFKLGYEIPETLLHSKLFRLGTAALEDPNVTNLVSRYRENRNVILSFTDYFFLVIGMLFTLIVAAVPLFLLLPYLTIALVVISIPSFVLNKRIINRLWQLDKDTTVESRRAGSLLGTLSSPPALKEVQLLNAYKYLRSYFDSYIKRFFDEKVKIYRYWNSVDVISMLVMGSIIVLGIYSLVGLVLDQVISVGQVAFYITSLISVGKYIDVLSSNMASFAGAGNRLAEVRQLLDYPEPDHSSKISIPRLETPPAIKLDNVSFKYPQAEKLVIENLNLEIKAGEKIAIVGENGAGKTTLVKLISNIYAPTSGQILIDDQDLNSIHPDYWYENLGVLYQDFNTYGDLTAFENIALGRINEELDYDRIRDAAKKADAHDFIMDYKDNYSQVLSERYEGGIRPSTGQWQKIAIARFFYRNAPVLILDEPTAAIDAVAEANIFDRIYKFIENKTVIIISHRFATVRNADRIIVFDHGKIVEEGTHTELLAKDGKYAHAFKLQAKGYS